MGMKKSDKRRYKRYVPSDDSERINIAVSVDDNKIAVSPNSISRNGCDFLLDHQIPTMTRLSLSIDLSEFSSMGVNLSEIDKHLVFTGTVVRTEEKFIDGKQYFHTAIYFGELPKRIMDMLSSIIRLKKHTPAVLIPERKRR